jgi:hypothetical protein
MKTKNDWRFLKLAICAIFGIMFICRFTQFLHAQDPITPKPSEAEKKTEPFPIVKLGKGLVSIGSITVDTNKKEIAVPGKMLRDQTLEFLATKKNGNKSYESVMELDTNATSFNLALIMIGLEKKNAVAPAQHFDTNPAGGDPVEIWVEWRKLGSIQVLWYSLVANI